MTPSRHHKYDAPDAVAGDALAPFLPPGPPPAPVAEDAADVEIVIPVPQRWKLKPWQAALASARIPYRSAQKRDGGWEMLVHVRHAVRARVELDAYERVNRGWPPRPAFLGPVSDVYPASAVLGLLPPAALVAFYLLTGAIDEATAEVARGSADADRIMAGEWWRIVTALTLHADLQHVLANALCLWWFGRNIGASVGNGLGWFAILLTGMGGNLLAACWEGAGHDAIGASTASFGALGILAALQFSRGFHDLKELRSVWSRSWLPLLAAVALLGFLGTSPRADLQGHLFGFLCGLGVAVLLLPVRDRRIPALLQAAAGLLAAAVVIGAWYLTMRGTG